MENGKLAKISSREKDVLSVLWRTGESLTASGIADIDNRLSINTVQSALRSLVKKNFIEVAEIVYSGTVLTRSYRPIVTAEHYAAEQLQSVWSNALNFSTLNFLDHLSENDDNSDVLEELEDIIRKKQSQEKK